MDECADCTAGFYCETPGLTEPTGPCDEGNQISWVALMPINAVLGFILKLYVFRTNCESLLMNRISITKSLM